MNDNLDRLPIALAAVAPHVDAATWANALLLPMRRSGLVTPRRAAMFLGQCAEESVGFTRLVEDTNYSARRLCEVWPTRFPDLVAAAPYSQRPEALANHVYANRLGNGDEASGDGWACRGVGLIQLTGRAEQERFAASVLMTREQVFAWAQTPAGAAASACWYWTMRGQLLALSDAWNIEAVTERVNGGLTNLPTRIALCTAALAVFGGEAPAPIFRDAPEAVAEASVSTNATATVIAKSAALGHDNAADSAATEALNDASLARAENQS